MGRRPAAGVPIAARSRIAGATDAVHGR